MSGRHTESASSRERSLISVSHQDKKDMFRDSHNNLFPRHHSPNY